MAFLQFEYVDIRIVLSWKANQKGLERNGKRESGNVNSIIWHDFYFLGLTWAIKLKIMLNFAVEKIKYTVHEYGKT